MSDRWTYDELYAKIDHEGGIEEALRWGVEPSDVPEEMEEAWALLIARYNVFDHTWVDILNKYFRDRD